MKLVVHCDRPEAIIGILERRLPDAAIAYCCDYESLSATLERERPEVLYSVRFAGTPTFPRHAILASPSLRWVSIGGSGTDHLAPWDDTRLTVTNAAGVGAETMAQYAIAAMLYFTLRLHQFARDQRERVWSRGQVASVEGKTLVIIGLGKTGLATARLAKALGINVVGVRARPVSTAHVDQVEPPDRLDAVLGEADFVVVCVPLTKRTRDLINADALRSAKPGAVLIDVSRGGVVRHDALIEALGQGRLAGAALDVFEIEPLPRDSPLWQMDNVILTPHCSSV
jgi:phosphoglycerate dehydrogenase-like enzyme